MKIIKREIVIDAPVAKVWKHITDPEKIAGWLMPNDFVAMAGKQFFLKCEHQEKISCVVKAIVPNQKLVYSFRLSAPELETRVTITLAKEGRATRLTLIHSGWDTLPPDEQGVADNYDGGWGGFLEKLQGQIVASTTD